MAGGVKEVGGRYVSSFYWVVGRGCAGLLEGSDGG